MSDSAKKRSRTRQAFSKKARSLKERASSKKGRKIAKGTRAQHKGKEAISEKIEGLYLEYRGSAHKIARSILRRWNARIELEELNSLVNLALCEAASNYNETNGTSFVTFLYYHIKGHLVKYISSSIKKPIAFGTLTDVDHSTDEEKYNSPSQGKQPLISQAMLEDAIMGNYTTSPDKVLLEKEISDVKDFAINLLDELEQKILRNCWSQSQSLESLAQELGYSRCHISRVKAQAIEKLKEILSYITDSEHDNINGENPLPISDLSSVVSQTKRIKIQSKKVASLMEELPASKAA